MSVSIADRHSGSPLGGAFSTMNSNFFGKFHATLFGCMGASLLAVWLLNWRFGFELNPALLAAIIGASALTAFTRQLN
jgi:uncharacterized membrane protein YeaQ/YmgE (transglycosylase-associated protein family)